MSTLTSHLKSESEKLNVALLIFSWKTPDLHILSGFKQVKDLPLFFILRSTSLPNCLISTSVSCSSTTYHTKPGLLSSIIKLGGDNFRLLKDSGYMQSKSGSFEHT